MIRQPGEQQLLAELAARFANDIHNGNIELPPAPNLLTRLSSLTTDSDSSFDEIVSILQTEPIICERLLQLANSANMAGHSQIQTLKAAVARLGLSRLQALASGLVMDQYLHQQPSAPLFAEYKLIRLKSIKVAAISYLLTAEYSQLEAEQALLAGLIHNIGMVPLIRKLASLPDVKHKSSRMKRLSEQLLPVFYPQIGYQLLAYWQLAPALRSVALNHQDLNYRHAGDIDLNDIVIVAYQLSLLVDFCNHAVIPESLVDSPAFQRLWPDWSTAIQQLSEASEKILQIQHDISG